MSGSKVKASKVKVHAGPDGTAPDGQFHVYVYDVFNRRFLPGRAFETVERAVQHQRHEQERIYLEQEADPELFDLPFISSDASLVERVDGHAEYRTRLQRDLDGEARSRGRKR